MADEARRREDASLRTEQQLKDFLSMYAQDQIDARAWRAEQEKKQKEFAIEVDNRLLPFEKMLAVVDTPAKIICGIVVIMATPVFGVLGYAWAKWLIDKVHSFIAAGKP